MTGVSILGEVDGFKSVVSLGLRHDHVKVFERLSKVLLDITVLPSCHKFEIGKPVELAAPKTVTPPAPFNLQGYETPYFLSLPQLHNCTLAHDLKST